jgi:hypothetical protein
LGARRVAWSRAGRRVLMPGKSVARPHASGQPVGPRMGGDVKVRIGGEGPEQVMRVVLIRSPRGDMIKPKGSHRLLCDDGVVDGWRLFVGSSEAVELAILERDFRELVRRAERRAFADAWTGAMAAWADAGENAEAARAAVQAFAREVDKVASVLLERRAGSAGGKAVSG